MKNHNRFKKKKLFTYIAARHIVLVMVAVAFGASLAAAATSSLNKLYRSTIYSHNDGRPGCRTNAEFGIKWANNFDNLRYWLCYSNGGAQSFVCPTEYLFDYDRQCCIRWNFWQWREPFDPPTLAWKKLIITRAEFHNWINFIFNYCGELFSYSAINFSEIIICYI